MNEYENDTLRLKKVRGGSMKEKIVHGRKGRGGNRNRRG